MSPSAAERARASRECRATDLKILSTISGKPHGTALTDGEIAKAAGVSAVTVQRARAREAGGPADVGARQRGNVYRLQL